MTAIQLNYDTWVDTYQPITNTFDKNASFDGHLFETYGVEVAQVRNTPTNRVWTLVECDGETQIEAGFTYVNRIGYFITEVPFEDLIVIPITTEDSSDD